MALVNSQEQVQVPDFLVDEPIEPGTKFDMGKLRFDLIPPRPMQALAEVYTFGATKYADRNWEAGIKFSRLYAAVQRHLHMYWCGQDLDEESGLPHLAHAMWGLAALLELQRTHEEMDDRP